jgi:hypothetical protein
LASDVSNNADSANDVYTSKHEPPHSPFSWSTSPMSLLLYIKLHCMICVNRTLQCKTIASVIRWV